MSDTNKNALIKPNSDNIIPNITDINVNNKDLLLVSLLEYICTINNKSKMFYIICEYLRKNNIIDTDDVYSLNTDYLRQIYVKMITELISDNQPMLEKSLDDEIDTSNISPDDNISNTIIDNIYLSRYKTDYLEIGKVGSGGFGSVYKAFNKIDGTAYAIKKITIRDLNYEKSNFYLNEVRHLARFNHKNVVRYFTSWIEFTDEYSYDNSEDSTSYNSDNSLIDSKQSNYMTTITGKSIIPILYIQMELCDISLTQYLESRNYKGSRINIKDDREIFKQLVNGLKYIHSEGIVHRDINPRNIFLTNNYCVKIGDFGLSKDIRNMKGINICEDSYGNTMYMAPEQLEDKIYNKKSDIYSLGIVYLELLKPFGTMVERFVTIDSLKNKEIDKLNDLDNKDLDLIVRMTDNDYNKRPSAKEIKLIMK